jgi:hypothetical protein
MAEEFDTLRDVRDTLRGVPNYNKYFVIDPITTCTPAALEVGDLDGFDELCHNFKRGGGDGEPALDASSVNLHLDSLTALTMPDAGSDLFSVIEDATGELSGTEFRRLNSRLIELLVNGIVPMNAAGLVHGDVKLENIAAATTRGADGTRTFDTVRLIDWGSAQTGVDQDPTLLINRPRKTGSVFMHNLPAGSVFLRKEPAAIDSELGNVRRTVRAANYSSLAVAYADVIYADARAAGETERINTVLTVIWPRLREDLHELKKGRTKMQVMSLFEILKKYYANSHLDVAGYVSAVFRWNCDVWGFLSVYRDLLGSGLAFVPSDEFTREANEILRAFMYDARYAATPINVPELAARLTTLNDLVGADEASPGLSVGAEGRERGDDDEEGGGDGEEEGSNRGSKRKRGASST